MGHLNARIVGGSCFDLQESRCKVDARAVENEILSSGAKTKILSYLLS